MTLDTRSEMALNLIIGMKVSHDQSFRTLASICARWGMSLEDSMPIVQELISRLKLSQFQAMCVLRSIMDEKEALKS